MSRDIKFQYIYGIDGKPETYFSRTFTLGEIENGLVLDEITDSPMLRGYKVIEARRFTGLHDKNGKDIFEGDIVSHHNKGLKGKVVFYEGAFIIRAGYSATHNALINFNVPKNIEVLGNIYENPELLEG